MAVGQEWVVRFGTLVNGTKGLKAAVPWRFNFDPYPYRDSVCEMSLKNSQESGLQGDSGANGSAGARSPGSACASAESRWPGGHPHVPGRGNERGHAPHWV